MTLAFLLAAIAVLLAPLLVRRLWQSTRTVLYQGTATPSLMFTEDLGQISKARYCWITIPGHEKALLAEIAPSRYDSLQVGTMPVNVTVVKHAFGKPAAESITFPGESGSESADNAPKIVAMAWYFATGLGALGLALHWSQAGADYSTLSLLSNYLAAILLAFAGFAAAMNQGALDKPNEAKVEFLGFNLGKGKSGMLVATTLAVVLTAAAFTWINILTIILGVNAAVAAGGLCAILWKMRSAGNPQQPPK